VKFTNLHLFPASIQHWILNDDYDSGAMTDISVSRLIDAPQIIALSKLHEEELTQDAKRAIAALIGKAVHKSLEQHAAAVGRSEQRLYADVNGVMVSGGVDLQEEDGGLVVSDYKTWKVIQAKSPKPEAVKQLNVYAELLRINGKKPVRLQVIAILKDWMESQADRDPGYPQSPVVVQPVPMWPQKAAADYLLERVKLHSLQTPPPCTDEERWKQSERWYVRVPGQKRRTGFDNEKEADAFAFDNLSSVEKDGGNYTRCEKNYCGVAEWCEQYQRDRR
jgi:hypothetical protein